MSALHKPLILLAISLASFLSVESAAQECNQRSGPGTEMTKIINRLGLGSDCQRCHNLAREMDVNGPAWVMNNFDCVVARTVSNAENLGHTMGPIRRVGVRSIIRTAVRRSRF